MENRDIGERGKIFSSSPNFLYRNSGPPIQCKLRAICQGLKRPELKADYSPSCSADIYGMCGTAPQLSVCGYVVVLN